MAKTKEEKNAVRRAKYAEHKRALAEFYKACNEGIVQMTSTNSGRGAEPPKS